MYVVFPGVYRVCLSLSVCVMYPRLVLTLAFQGCEVSLEKLRQQMSFFLKTVEKAVYTSLIRELHLFLKKTRKVRKSKVLIYLLLY